MPTQQPLLDTLSALRQFRVDVQNRLAAATWTVQSHGDHDAIGLVWVATAHVAAVEVLGKQDSSLVLPATAAARAAYEAAVMAAWLVEPGQFGERDRRWFGLLLDERSFWQVMVREAHGRNDTSEIVDLLLSEVARVDAILADVAPKLETLGIKQPAHPPRMDQLLEAVGKRKHYVSYKFATQFGHPGMRALRQVRDLRDHEDGQGDVGFRWRTSPGEWSVAILLAAESLMYGLETLFGHLNPVRPVDNAAVDMFHEVVRRVPGLGPPTDSDALTGPLLPESPLQDV